MATSDASNKHNTMSELDGFYYFPDAIGEELSTAVINFLNIQQWEGITTSATGRKVQQYGYKYDYNNNSKHFEKITDIPDPVLKLKQVACEIADSTLEKEFYDLTKLNQCIVNQYKPGHGISAHIDRPALGNIVVCFTLGSGATLTFTTKKGGKEIRVDKYVEPNSLYFMTGDSRYSWQHEIKPRLSDGDIKRGTRISVTLRTVNQ